MQKNHVQCSHRWVKGHQDCTKSLQEINEEGLLNIEVDHLATSAYGPNSGGYTEAMVTVFAEEVCVLIDGSKITSKIKQQVIDKCRAEPFEKYLISKHQLSEGKMAGINWAALAGYLKSLSPPRRASQVKLQQNWIPTNSFLFQQKRALCDTCPLCKSTVETPGHIRRCRDPATTQYRREQMAKFMRDLRGINTAPEIIQCWHEHIATLCGDSYDDEVYSVSQIKTLLCTARHHQSVLSWEDFLHGRISIHWSAVQASHEGWRRQETASHRRQLSWDQHTVRLVCEFHSDLWQHRIEEVHGKNQLEAQQKLRASRYPTLLARYPSIYSVPLEFSFFSLLYRLANSSLVIHRKLQWLLVVVLSL